MWHPVKSKYSVKKPKAINVKAREHIAAVDVLEKDMTRIIGKLINAGLEDAKLDGGASEQAVILLRDSLRKIKQAKKYLERSETE